MLVLGVNITNVKKNIECDFNVRKWLLITLYNFIFSVLNYLSSSIISKRLIACYLFNTYFINYEELSSQQKALSFVFGCS